MSELAIHSNHLGGGIAEIMEMILVFFEQLISMNASAILPTIVPGLSAMSNWHPFFVHFPIALLPTFFLLDVVGAVKQNKHLRKVASYFLYLGTLGAIVTVFAGFKAAESVVHGGEVHGIMTIHEIYGLAVTGLALVLVLWRFRNDAPNRPITNILHQILSFLLCVFLILGADLGGLMVYKYGVGVDIAKPTFDSHEHMQKG